MTCKEKQEQPADVSDRLLEDTIKYVALVKLPGKDNPRFYDAIVDIGKTLYGGNFSCDVSCQENKLVLLSLVVKGNRVYDTLRNQADKNYQKSFLSIRLVALRNKLDAQTT